MVATYSHSDARPACLPALLLQTDKKPTLVAELIFISVIKIVCVSENETNGLTKCFLPFLSSCRYSLLNDPFEIIKLYGNFLRNINWLPIAIAIVIATTAERKKKKLSNRSKMRTLILIATNSDRFS